MIYLDKTIINQEMIDAAAESLANEPTLFGESISKFEEEFANFCEVDYAISVASGTDALTFSLMAADVKGKKVLTTPSSYIATANVALLAGGEPIFCDIDEKTNNIDHLEIKKSLSKNSKIAGIIPVHLHGCPADMDEIMELADKKGVFVVEDACQAHGARYFGKRVGSIAHAGAFSFNPVKNMTVGGSAGMVTTNDEKIAKKVRMLADSGRETPYTHEHAIIGFSSRLNTVNAAIGRVQLRYLDTWNERRREVARQYRKLLDKTEVELPYEGSNVEQVYNKFAIKSPFRDRIREYIYEKGIESDSHYPIPIHLQPPYRKMGYKKGDYPKAEKFADTTLSLPMSVEMREDDIFEVSKRVTESLPK